LKRTTKNVKAKEWRQKKKEEQGGHITLIRKEELEQFDQKSGLGKTKWLRHKRQQTRIGREKNKQASSGLRLWPHIRIEHEEGKILELLFGSRRLTQWGEKWRIRQKGQFVVKTSCAHSNQKHDEKKEERHLQA